MDFFNPQIKRYKLILENMIPGESLDLGCKKGKLHSFLVQNFPDKILGLDIEDGENVDVQHDLNEPLPFEDNRFSNIVAGEIIEHVLEPYKFLKECYRVLKPGGRLILTTPNAIGLQNILFHEDHAHYHAWELHMLTELMEKAGFKILVTKKLNIYWNRNLLLRFIGFIFPKIRPDLFVVAEKPTS